jgi:hypothetical protein
MRHIGDRALEKTESSPLSEFVTTNAMKCEKNRPFSNSPQPGFCPSTEHMSALCLYTSPPTCPNLPVALSS